MHYSMIWEVYKMYENLVILISTLIMTVSPTYIRYIIENLINIVKFYICTIEITKLYTEV